MCNDVCHRTLPQPVPRSSHAPTRDGWLLVVPGQVAGLTSHLVEDVLHIPQSCKVSNAPLNRGDSTPQLGTTPLTGSKRCPLTLMNEFMMDMALDEIPVSGCTCFKTL